MRVGVPRESKTHEYRVGLTPTSVRELAAHGHELVVEAGAGAGIGAADSAYEKAGGRIGDPWDAELIVKVKEPQPAERKRLRGAQVLFAYLHLAPDPAQASDLLDAGAVCIAYETVTRAGGGLPLLAPMSEVAGSSAARLALGAGARVYILDKSLDVLRRIDAELGARVVTVYSSRDALEQHVLSADLAIGAVLVPGAATPRLVSRAMVRAMKRGAAVVDISIDQGGCFETSRPTTHADPTYTEEGVVHYCVTNMPGAVPRTSTYALNNATLPFVLALADKGWQRALAEDEHLRNGLNVARGKVTHPQVAAALGAACVPAAALLS